MTNRIRELRKQRGLTISQYENGRRQPDTETLLRLGEYFGVTVGYILGVEERKAPTLNDKDERDIARTLEKLMSQLDSSGDIMFDGDPVSDEARESIRSAMKLGLEAAKLKNKERFTPKKYRKG